MTSLSIAQDPSNTFSGGNDKNDGFQIAYIDVNASQTGLTSYSYPIDIAAAIQDSVGTPESFTSLALSELPTGSSISVVDSYGIYHEIAPVNGVYDLSAYTSLLSTATTISGTDKIYLTTTSALPNGFTPTLTLETTDGSSTAKTIIGGSGNSTLNGGTGNDYISGGAGVDNINGGTGNDLLIGDSGNDILRGGTGSDQLTGGSGADLFIWQKGDTGTGDVIKDFNPSEGDRIDLRDLLQGETDATMSNFLQIDTTSNSLLISSTGQLNVAGGTVASHADTTIKLDGFDLSSASINTLIAGADPTIKVDHS